MLANNPLAAMFKAAIKEKVEKKKKKKSEPPPECIFQKLIKCGEPKAGFFKAFMVPASKKGDEQKCRIYHVMNKAQESF